MEELKPKGDVEVRAALTLALDRARAQSRYADVLYERIYKSEASLLSSGQVSIKPASLKGAAQIRLVGDAGRHVGIRVGEVTPDGLASAVDRAARALAEEPPSEGYGLCPIPNPTRERYGLALTQDPRTTDPTDDLLGLVRAVERLASDGVAAGVRVLPEVWAWTQVEDKWIADTEGVFKTQVLPVTFLQVVFRAVQGERQARTRVRFGELAGLAHYIQKGELSDFVRDELTEARDRAVQLLAARALTPEERARVTHYILHKTSLVFIHEGLGHPIEADIVRAGGSAIVAPDGEPRVKPLGSPVVRIVDGPAPDPRGRPMPDRGFGTEMIDDEGVEVQAAVLVDGGDIVGMMHSRETAFRYGAQPTGNGFSELGDRRIVRMRNTTLCPNEGDHWVDSLDALVKDVSLGVVLHGSLGGAVSKEGMSSSTQYGWLVRDGHVTGEMIAPGNFTAVTVGCLKTVEGYAGGLEAHGVGFCGKNGQRRRVTEGGPEYVKIGASPSVLLTFEG